jgi:ABC-type multidrug transport system ATPase subunit
LLVYKNVINWTNLKHTIYGKIYFILNGEKEGDTLICIDNLVKVYGEREVIKGISLTIHKGEILGFLGPNGAGKTTTMNIIVGYLSPTEGTVKIENIDILEKPKEAKKN